MFPGHTRKIDGDTNLHRVLILAGEGVNSALLDALLALGEALVPGSEVGLARVIRRGADFKRCQGEGRSEENNRENERTRKRGERKVLTFQQP